MFEIIETIQLLNITCYKVKTSLMTTWFFIKNGHFHYVEDLNYDRQTDKKQTLYHVGLPSEDYQDFYKIFPNLKPTYY